MRVRPGRVAAIAAVVLALAMPARAITFLSVGSGELDGGYYRVVRAICAAVNASAAGKLRCSVEPTPGSIYNLIAIAAGQLDLALVQSDWLVHAVRGTSVFASRGPDTGLRVVLPLHLEPVTFVVRSGAGIAGVRDLAGRRVDLGHPASGRRATMQRLMEEYGLTSGDFAATTELALVGALEEICAGRIDALVVVTGHPSARLGAALDGCDLRLVPLQGAEADRMIAAGEGFVPATIDPADYPALAAPVPTIAVRAMLVSRATLADETARAIVASVRANAARLQAGQPLLRGFDLGAALGAAARGAQAAPLHPGAAAALGTP